jgi:hypothetical protein
MRSINLKSAGPVLIFFSLGLIVFSGSAFLTLRYLQTSDISYSRPSVAAAAEVADLTSATSSTDGAADGANFAEIKSIFDGTTTEDSQARGQAATREILPPVVGINGVTHIPTPKVVQAVYMSQCTAGAPELRKKLVDFIKQSGLNAIVIDIKDFSGGIAFPTDDPLLSKNVSHECGAHDMKTFVESLHKSGIYVIGRITVFQDPTYTNEHPEEAVQDAQGGLWKNYGGLSFVDVGAKPFWDYIVRLAQVSYSQIGFDELNFDYIRYPSDGPLKDAVYSLSKDKTKTQALKEFFSYLHAQLQPDGSTPGIDAPRMSADMFGMVSSHQDDLGIGQILEGAFPYFDYIDPMMYPSHYPKGFDGYQDVNAHSSDIVYNETKAAVGRAIDAGYTAEKIRPWLQSFDYPVAYTPGMVEGQIDAEKKGGADSYLFWDAANKYISLRQVLLQ